MFGDAHVVPRKQEINMILTVTMNPSIDTRYQLDKLIIDDVNRVTPEKTAGGKGLNVSRVLLQLGDDVLATGLLGGHMGAYMAELMDADGVKNDFVPIAGETRICLNILHEGNQTELLESGPQIAPAELDAFTAKFAELAAQADVVTLSGSLPRGVDAGYYAELVKIAEEAGAKVLLDTSGASLEAALESDAKPELVKPNLTEINGLLGTSFTTDDVDALREALAADGRFAGIPWVVVSMGAAGSVGFHGSQDRPPGHGPLGRGLQQRGSYGALELRRFAKRRNLPTLQTRQSGNLPFSFSGMIKRSMPPRFKAPCSFWRVFAAVAKTSALPWSLVIGDVL